MTRRVAFPVAALFAVVFSCPADGRADDERLGAFRALELITERFGSEWVGTIVEMKAQDAQPQPEEWRVTVYDPSSPTTFREFWAGSGYATNEGVDYDFLPDKAPGGYIRRGAFSVGSKQAFAIAERLARSAKVGFDSLDFHLAVAGVGRWEVTLRNSDYEVVGKVYVSASSGDVLRTVWIRRTKGGRMVIEDSALSG